MKSSASEPGLKYHIIQRFGLGDAFGDFYLSVAWWPLTNWKVRNVKNCGIAQPSFSVLGLIIRLCFDVCGLCLDIWVILWGWWELGGNVYFLFLGGCYLFNPWRTAQLLVVLSLQKAILRWPLLSIKLCVQRGFKNALTTCKVVTLRGGQWIIAVHFFTK